MAGPLPVVIAFADLRTAAYCPRKLYYRRREDDRSPPPAVERRRALAGRYPELVEAPTDALAALPLAVEPADYRRNLRRLRERPLWEPLVDPLDRDRLLTGRDCRGIARKLVANPDSARSVAGDPTVADRETDLDRTDDRPSPVLPVLVSAGEPPERGVWEPRSVHAVAAAKALAYERGHPVERALVEYPAVGVVRTVRLTTRRRARYRRALRTARSVDGPPPRIDDDAKCEACEYVEECGVRTRTLRSLL
jgi:CRISPR-associated exonuclease Cas4